MGFVLGILQASRVVLLPSSREREQGTSAPSRPLRRCSKLVLPPCTPVQMIKEALDRRYGGPWHVVVGKAFAFEVTHEVG